MSDYKRFVAYLYEYHDQSKGENRGFVRVEARNGTCQMAFQLKVFSLPEGSPLNVYGFVRIRNYLYGIPVGILRAGRNGISGRLMTPSVHMGDSSFSLNELGGLILFGQENKIYATQWDDVPIRPEQFTTDISILQEPAPAETAASSNDNSSPEPEKDPASSASASVRAASAAVESLPDGPETEEFPAETAGQEAQETETQAETAGSSPGERWKFLLESCPHFQPFDDDEISECIRLDLKDLPLLRKSGWQIGNNQFLLHGFYNYRHLLMGRLPDKSPETFIFGVPGIFDVKEQFMAGMFGFSSFKPARSSRNASDMSPFGYWYRPVQ